MTKTEIDGIPDDLLSKIVIHYVAEAASPFRSSESLIRSRITTRLRLVCNRWNLIVLSMPTLWNQLNITLPDIVYFRRDGTLPPSILTLWLQRSAQSPLQLEIRFPEVWNPKAFDLLDVLWTSVHRWKTVYFAFPLRPCLEKCLSPSHHLSSARMLEHVRISGIGRQIEDNSVTYAITYFSAIPNLASLQFEANGFSILTAINCHMPVSQLAKLTVTCNAWPQGDFDDLWDIIRACTSLVWLSVDHQGSSYLGLTSDPIDLPYLRVLDIRTHNASPDNPLLMLCCPELEVLSLRGSFSSPLTPVQFALRLISRCNPSLQLLRLHFNDSRQPVQLKKLFSNSTVSNSRIAEVQVSGYRLDSPDYLLLDLLERWDNSGRIIKGGGSCQSLIIGWKDVELADTSEAVREYFADKDVRPLQAIVPFKKSPGLVFVAENKKGEFVLMADGNHGSLAAEAYG